MGNLPAKTKSKAVNKLFSEYGKIESIRFRSLSMSKIDDHEGTVSRSQLIKTRQAQADSAQSAINAYVVFETNDAAQAALARNGHILQERHLRVDIAANAKQHDNTVSIFVGNLVLDVTDEELWDFFGDCGDVSSVRVIRDPLTGVGKGIAFVKFAERGAVTTAVEKSGIHLRGRAVRVSRATADASERGGGKKTKGGKSRTPAAASPKPSSPKINPRKRDGEGNKRRWSREGKPEPSPVTTRIAAVKTSKAGKSASKRDATGKKKRWRDRDGSQSDETGADMTGGFSGLKAIPGVLPDWVESVSFHVPGCCCCKLINPYAQAKSGKAGGKAGGRSEAKKKASVKAHKKELRDSKKVKSASKKAKAAEKAEGKSGSESKKGKKAKATSRSIY